jgi:hypothetical protein
LQHPAVERMEGPGSSLGYSFRRCSA